MEREEIAPQEQFLLLPTIFCYLMLDFNVKTRIRFSHRDKRLFEINVVEITRVDYTVVSRYNEANLIYVIMYTFNKKIQKNITN